MAFFVINCSFDFKLFESSMYSLSHSSALCVMVTYLPEGYNSSLIFSRVLDDFNMYSSDFFILLVKQPFPFARRNPGTKAVIFGTLVVCGDVYGVVASQHYDVLLESPDVVASLLPTVFACCDSLQSGNTDFSGTPVEKCRYLVVFGALFCKGYPVRSDYLWPDFSGETLPEIMPITASIIQSRTCTYQPFVYDWRSTDLMIGSSDQSDCILESEVDAVVSACCNNLKRGYDFTAESVTNESANLDAVKLKDFLCRPYFPKSFKELMLEIKGVGTDSDNFCFSSSWVQMFSGNKDEDTVRGSCIHSSTGPDLSMYKCPSRYCNPDPDDDFLNVYPTETLYAPYIPVRENGLERKFKATSDFMRVIVDYHMLFVKNGYGCPNLSKKYLIVHKHLLNILQRFGQSCYVFVGQARTNMPRAFCLFGIPHSRV